MQWGGGVRKKNRNANLRWAFSQPCASPKSKTGFRYERKILISWPGHSGLRACQNDRSRHLETCRRTLRMSAYGEDRKWTVHGQNGAIDPNVWSGHALQEVSSTWQMRSCINVSGL